MRRLILAIAGLGAIAGAAFWLLTSPALQAAGTEPIPGGEANLENGRILYLAGGCASCHATPGQDDRNRLGGGLTLGSPFGTFHVPNTSPHPRDGIGGWSDAQFVRAMRAGVAPDGRHYYPAFPYTSYQRMGAADLRDMFAFLRTLPPVEGRVRDHDLAFPFNIRRGVGFWKLLYLDGREFVADPARSAEWNRGAYLTEGPTHCAECHSPRNAFGAVVAERRFAGGPDPAGRGFVPNITPHATGIGRWSKSEIVELLTSGFTPEYDSVGSNMKPVVDNLAKIPASDRAAIAEYLKSLPAIETVRPAARPQG